jgi:hypothetical protein
MNNGQQKNKYFWNILTCLLQAKIFQSDSAKRKKDYQRYG